MITRFFQGLFLLFFANLANCQDAPNVSNASGLSPNSSAAAKASTANVNNFTGTPGVSIPLYTYTGKGMSLNISAEWTGGGGVKDGESASTIGTGWFLSTGGAITRTVRGTPDDMPVYGFLNAVAVPIDYRSNGNKYYYDSLDAEQDVFNFSFNGRSGKFIIGKNHQVVITPQSKLKVEYTTDQTTGLIIAFKITAENGVKYLFNMAEPTTLSINQGSSFFKSGYSYFKYNSGWYLTQIISPYNTDTIKFSYYNKTLNTVFSYPSTQFVKVSDHSQTALYSASGNNSANITKLTGIDFPDQTSVKLIYGNTYKYDDTDYALTELRIMDTVFRKGYLFDYTTSFNGPVTKYDGIHEKDIVVNMQYTTKLLLASITPFNLKEKTKGYSFAYNVPYPDRDSWMIRDSLTRDSVSNGYDYWGYFTGWRNMTNAIPYIPGVNLSGANRTPSAMRITENSLSYVYLPEGGVVHYEYEPNTVAPYTLDSHQLSVSSSNASSSNTVTFSQVFSPWHQVVFSFSNSFSRSGTAPLSGTCNLVCNVKSTDGNTLYATTTFSMYDLFYEGVKTWAFNVPNGNYRIETSLSGGGSITTGYPFYINWTNKLTGTSDVSTGGIRISRIVTQTKANASDSITEDYSYVDDSGKSTGFLGDIPQYYYPFLQVISSPSSSTNLYAISSDPINFVNYAQGSPVGYSRVTVIKGTAAKNLGKTIYEFTNLSDVNTNYFLSSFPYAPQDIKDWGLGLPKRISVYDSSGNIVQRTTNQYSFNSTAYNTSDFRNMKIGCASTSYTNDPATNPNTPRINAYVGQEYYPSSGWAALSASADSLYHPDGSIQTSGITYTYDSYYNVTKATAPYDRARGLNIETRIYYPYNYTLSSGAIKTLKDSNIISQVISTEKWITGDANPRMVDATITDFMQLTQKYIVPQYVYTLQTNQPVSQAAIGTFNASSLVRNTTYFVKQQSLPVYYSNGVPAQTTNVVSGQNASIITDYNNQYVIAKVQNAAFSDVAYTSFESDGTGNWTIASGLRDKSAAVTGKQSYNLSSGSLSVTGLTSSTTYLITGWAKPGAVIYVNGSNITAIYSPISTHNGWNLYSQAIGGITTLTITGSGLVDEVRLHPNNANMITYTYEPQVGITSTCDANNSIVYTQYDNLNRVKLVKDIDLNIIKRFDYADSSYPLNNAVNWVGTGIACKGFNGEYDSVYTDQNPYSNSYQDTMRLYKGYFYCGCAIDPAYKIIGNTCVAGTKVITASVHYRVSPGVYEWHCTYHYKWPDGSVSQDYTEVDPDSPISPCDIEQ